MSSNWKNVRVGSRIAIYFKDARCFYACKVLSKDDRKGEGHDPYFRVKYEDDSIEWKNLARCKFRWQDFYGDSEEDGETAEAVKEEEDALSDEGSSADDVSDIVEPAKGAKSSPKSCNSKSKGVNVVTKEEDKDIKGSEVLKEEEEDQQSGHHKDEDIGKESEVLKVKEEDQKSEKPKDQDRVNDSEVLKKEKDSKISEDPKDEDIDEESEVPKEEEENKESENPKDQNKNKDSEVLKEEGENKHAGSLKDKDSDQKSEEPQSKKNIKRKANASTARATKLLKHTTKISIKAEDDGSDATPIMQSEEEDSNIVTPPPANRAKSSEKQEDRKANESGGGADDNKNGDNDDNDNDNDSHEKDDEKVDGKQEQKPKKGVKRKAAPAKKPAKKPEKKPAPKRNNRKKAASSQDTKPPKKKRLTIKDVKKAHEKKETSKEDALLSVMIVHHMAGTKSLAFEKLVSSLGYKPKNKTLEQAWKDVRLQKLVEEAAGGKKKAYQLTQKGIDKIASEDYKHELANPPKTTSELHERIKTNTVNKYGTEIFELLLGARNKGDAQSDSMSTQELATECGVNKDTHGFFYGLKQLKDNGYVVPNPKEKLKLLLSEKCFLDWRVGVYWIEFGLDLDLDWIRV